MIRLLCHFDEYYRQNTVWKFSLWMGLRSFFGNFFPEKYGQHRFWPAQCRGGMVLAPLCLYFSCRRPPVLRDAANISSIPSKLKKILTIIHGPSRFCANFGLWAIYFEKNFLEGAVPRGAWWPFGPPGTLHSLSQAPADRFLLLLPVTNFLRFGKIFKMRFLGFFEGPFDPLACPGPPNVSPYCWSHIQVLSLSAIRIKIRA